MQISFEHHGNILCSRLEGDDSLDSTNSVEVKHALGNQLAPENDLVVDLSAIRFIDSSGVGTLVSVLKKVRRSNRRMVLSGVTPPVRSILEIIRLTAIFDLRETLAESIAALKN